MLELALGFHHSVRDDRDQVETVLTRLHELTRGDGYACYSDIVSFTVDLPTQAEWPSPVRWLGGEAATRDRWRGLVTTGRVRPQAAL
ncbi:hypothetical protein [Streptomyces sp. NPDC001978]|uniref:hypothetical protein n=1 Tax=Streptomyces sp. NPDC001978 TaxID=3364627 RepID=UPI003676FB9F